MASPSLLLDATLSRVVRAAPSRKRFVRMCVINYFYPAKCRSLKGYGSDGWLALDDYLISYPIQVFSQVDAIIHPRRSVLKVSFYGRPKFAATGTFLTQQG